MNRRWRTAARSLAVLWKMTLRSLRQIARPLLPTAMTAVLRMSRRRYIPEICLEEINKQISTNKVFSKNYMSCRIGEKYV